MTPGRSFTPADRIRRRSEYQHVYENGRKIVSKSFVLFHLPNAKGRPRLGITVTRRVGPAVLRNRAKRLFREWFRGVRPDLPAQDFVVNAREGVHRMSLDQLSREMRAALRRLGIRESGT